MQVAQLFVFLSLCLYGASTIAVDNTGAGVPLEITGQWRQGELLHGKTEVGAKVEILGNQVYVSDKGEFVFGLGRNAPATVAVSLQLPSGARHVISHSVAAREYNTQRIEGIKRKHVSPPLEVSKRIKHEAAKVWRARQLKDTAAHFAEGFSWPLIGPITGVYGSQRFYNGVAKNPHYGLDIAGPVGALVVAPAKGRVTLTHQDMYYSGGTLIIDHGQGLSSTFIHLSKILVEEGAFVDKGQGIAEVGATGRATGPHLDWRINWLNQRLDPQLLVPPMPMPEQKSVR